jgi:lambda family phage portal protein
VIETLYTNVCCLSGVYETTYVNDNRKNNAEIMASGMYDATATTSKNREHWRWATDADGDEIANESERRIARIRCRYEFLNNGYARNSVRIWKSHIVGKRGPQLKIPVTDVITKQIKDHLEWQFYWWTLKTGLVQKLRMMTGALLYDGESFLHLTHDPHIFPVAMNAEVIDAKNITNNGMEGMDEFSIDGIHFDRYGHPDIYYMLQRVPNPNMNYNLQPVEVPAWGMLHLVDPELPQQHRGMPVLLTVLEKIAQLRRWDTYSLGAAEQAARLSGVLQTSGTPDISTPRPNQTLVMAPSPGNLMTIPTGWTLQQTKAEFPLNNHGDFVQSQLTEIGAGIGTPRGMLQSDCSGYNYSSWRGEKQTYWSTIDVQKDILETTILNPLFHRFMFYLAGVDDIAQKVMRAHGWDGDRINKVWQFAAPESADPVHDAQADEIKLRIGTTSRARICAANGEEYEEIVEELKTENATQLNAFTEEVAAAFRGMGTVSYVNPC